MLRGAGALAAGCLDDAPHPDVLPKPASFADDAPRAGAALEWAPGFSRSRLVRVDVDEGNKHHEARRRTSLQG